MAPETLGQAAAHAIKLPPIQPVCRARGTTSMIDLEDLVCTEGAGGEWLQYDHFLDRCVLPLPEPQHHVQDKQGRSTQGQPLAEAAQGGRRHPSPSPSPPPCS